MVGLTMEAVGCVVALVGTVVLFQGPKRIVGLESEGWLVLLRDLTYLNANRRH